MKTNPADYLFVSSSDGNLYDTRIDGWYKQTPLRTNYNAAHRTINTITDLKAMLRHGEYAFPGGYKMAFVTSDGATICFDCVIKEIKNVMWSMRNNCDDGWKVIACDILYNGEEDVYCDHCGENIINAAQ